MDDEQRARLRERRERLDRRGKVFRARIVAQRERSLELNVGIGLGRAAGQSLRVSFGSLGSRYELGSNTNAVARMRPPDTAAASTINSVEMLWRSGAGLHVAVITSGLSAFGR